MGFIIFCWMAEKYQKWHLPANLMVGDDVLRSETWMADWWHGISGFPPGESGRKKPHQRCWFCYHELRWWWNMVFVRCFIYVFTEGHMFGTFWLDTCLLSAKLQQPRSTWQNEESTLKGRTGKSNSAGPFCWTLDIKPCNTICFPWTGHIFVGEIPCDSHLRMATDGFQT